jgi:hypothetical protein
VQAAGGDQVYPEGRCVLAQAVDEQVSALAELRAQAAEVGDPAGVGDYFDGCLLEQGADIERLCCSVGQRRSRTGPRAMTAPTRMVGDMVLVKERM